MKRSPIWIAAYVSAWKDSRDLRVWLGEDPPTGGEPAPAADIARLCARTADACEAGYIAAFGRVEDGDMMDVLREAISDLLDAHGPVMAERRDSAGVPIYTTEQNALRRLRRLITDDK